MMYQVIMLIQIVSIVILTLESIYVFFNWNTKGHSYLFLYCFAAMINNSAYLIEMNAASAEESFAAVRLCYAGKVWVPIAFLVMVLEFCGFKISKIVYGVLAAVHTSIFFIVLSSGQNTLYYTAERSFDTSGTFPVNHFGHAPLYWAYMVLILIYIICGVSILIYKCVTEKEGSNRSLYELFLFAAIAMSASYIAYLCKWTAGFDATCVGYAAASLFLFRAIFKYNLLNEMVLVNDYVMDTLSEGVIAEDNSGRIIYYNAPFTKVCEDAGFDIKDSMDFIKNQAQNSELVYVGDSIFEPIKSPLMHKGKCKGNVYVLTDVTASHKHMEELQEQKDIAEEANASKSAFLSVVSHEIRTPMNAVVGMTDLLLRDKDSLNDKQEKYLKNIKNSGAALVMIVNDILDQSKIEAGKMELVDSPYEIRPMIDDVKMIIENRIGTKPIHLTCEVDDEVPQILVGDSLRIRQILINLMNNAVKFTEDGFIQLKISVISLLADKTLLHFSVRDSGQGIREEDLDRLGQAFAQVDVAKNHSKEGTGLGLSISKDFISMMGGQLQVASEYGKGSEFYFDIEQGIADSIEEAEDNGLNNQAWQKEIEFTAPKAKVLIVDDTEINLMVTRELLSPLNMSVDTADSGEKALEATKNGHYDLIFMDYMMPYMDGVETTKKIRLMADAALDEGNEELAEYYRTVPIITLSGDTSDETKEKFMRAGIDDFTEKPVEISRLKKIIIKWLPENMIEKAN